MMIELPEAMVLARQWNETLQGKVIEHVSVNSKPHKLAWFVDEGKDYQQLLKGKGFSYAVNFAGYVCLYFEDAQVIFHDGVNLRYFHTMVEHGQHQLLIVFSDQSCLMATVAMYGGLYVTKRDIVPTTYMKASVDAIDCLSSQFTFEFFMAKANEKLSLKAFLATEQRFPGIGNGVIQDILFKSGLHPKLKIRDCDDSQLRKLYEKLVTTIREMVALGGRNNETDLFGMPGGYEVLMTSAQLKNPCRNCSGSITKESYMGGSIYFCPRCQPLKNV
jgi:formamidopyrimidine-DNA glycosylase